MPAPIVELVEDWPAVKQRWEAWWQQEIVDRVVISITAPRAGVYPVEFPPVDPETQWTSAEAMVRRTLETIHTTYYGGEALPMFNHNWSAGHALYLGCQPRFAPDTVWVDPAPTGPDGYPHFSDAWRENPWWEWMQEATRHAARESLGRYFMQALWGNHAGDNLALARGTQNLLYDIAVNPAWVRSAVRRLSEIQIEALEVLWGIMGPGRLRLEGSMNYVGCWSPARTLGLDCDFSCMISPNDFREIFLPPLMETMATAEHRIYHLDGAGALSHLETLLSMTGLQAIQWVPGAGREAIRQWIPLIQRIQEAGKCIAVAVQPEEIDLLLREVRPQGLFISTTCRSEDQARSLLERIAQAA